MKYLLLAIFALLLVRAAGEPPPPRMNVIPSWGDMTLVYGPGTDAAMDSVQAMENMVRHWKGRGFTGVYLRSDLQQFLPGSVVRHKASTQPSATLAVAWHIIDEIMEKSDPHLAAGRAAEKLGFEYWIFHPYIYSEGAPPDVGVPGPGRMIPWSYMRKYHQEHPEVITVDRQGNKQWMVPEYAYPGARADKAAEFAHMAKTYHPTGIIASMRSESSQLIPPPDHGDQYGFNQPVVDEMKRLYNVDILTDPRFDWKSASFNSRDPMVENWRNLRGSFITQLYRDIRQAMREATPKVQFAVTLSGDYVGPIMGNARLEWRKWIDEGIVDVIILPDFYEATLDPETTKKGYLTDARNGVGTASAAQVKEYILNSRHPEIKVIQTGASSYFYEAPPKGADGWRCDAWYDSYHVAFYQRWQQWQKDLSDFGAIKFFEQNFDAFPVKNSGISGGCGDGRYHPELRACPGVWYTLGDGSDARPFVQQEIRHGNSGSALALRGKDIMAVHGSSPDRSLLTGVLDTAIANGKATFSCWVYRAGESTSLSVYFTGNASFERDVAVRIEPKTGYVSYRSGDQWTETDRVVPIARWTPITIEVSLDTQYYSAWVGEERSPVCSSVGYAPPNERYVTQHGVETERIKVPSYRLFNTLIFVPAEGSREFVYLDDVAVNWKPTIPFAKPGRRKLLEETFESAPAGATALGNAAIASKSFVIEKSTSYGPGVHCARATGGGELSARLNPTITPASAKSTITVDLDFFIRSDKDFPYMIPDPTTRSPHSFVLNLEGNVPDKPFAAVDTTSGTWRLWDGQKFVDTGKLVTYDVWNHLQLAINPREKSYVLVVQPVGELPTLIGRATCGESVKGNEPLKLKIKPSATTGHVSCYDNILVARD